MVLAGSKFREKTVSILSLFGIPVQRLMMDCVGCGIRFLDSYWAIYHIHPPPTDAVQEVNFNTAYV